MDKIPDTVWRTRRGLYYHRNPTCGRWSKHCVPTIQATRSNLLPCSKCITRAIPGQDSAVRTRGGTNFGYKWRILKVGASRRKLKVGITKNMAHRLMKSDCTYCGEKSAGTRVNGIDRVDNAKGYIRSNCVPCCSTCNRMKWVYNVKDFVRGCTNVAKYEGEDGKHSFGTNWKGSPFAGYRVSATRRGLAFELSRRLFRYLTRESKCSYCGKQGSRSSPLGVDRVDNRLGYTPTNCVPCCPRCNRMKGTTPAEVFRRKCVQVSRRCAHLL